MTVFGLVHGAWQGAWCWELLIEELRRRGHEAVAVDLPSDDPTNGAARYAEVVVDALAGEPGDDLVLVGHALGGLTIPLVAQMRPVRRLVYLCALLPDPGTSVDEQRRTDRDMFLPRLGRGQHSHPDGSSSWFPQAATRRLYADCPRDVARWAASRLRRQACTPTHEVTPLVDWPDVESVSVVCTGDAVINPEWSRRTTRRRLAVEPVELDGGHSPFLARPGELADLLVA